MASLHISKVAVGCASFDALHRRQELRAAGGIVPIRTRFLPRRSSELVGGSIFWIIKHRMVARQTILEFAEDAEERKTIIRLDADLVPVRALPKRAHQGWRYLEAQDAPDDLYGPDDGLAALPPPLADRLSSLALI
jgi:hypothetical protein